MQNGQGKMPYLNDASLPILHQTRRPDPPAGEVPDRGPILFRLSVYDDVTPIVYGVTWFDANAGRWTIALDGAMAPIQSTSPLFLRTLFRAFGWVEVDGEGKPVTIEGEATEAERSVE